LGIINETNNNNLEGLDNQLKQERPYNVQQASNYQLFVVEQQYSLVTTFH
jgi:hypothetical protein